MILPAKPREKRHHFDIGGYGMANPQKEHGYTPISNELLDQIISSDFNATQLKIIFAIFRYTYGYNRKSHVLSMNFLSITTGVSKRNIRREFKNLLDGNVIKVTKDCSYTSPREVSVNKNYEQWGSINGDGYRGLTHPLGANPSPGDKLTPRGGGESVLWGGGEYTPHIKQNIKQNKNKEYCAFFESVWLLYPNKKGKARITDKTKRALYALGYDTVKTCIERYVKEKPEWKEYQHGSTFFTSGYVDYLDENYSGQGVRQQSAEDVYGKL